MRMRGLEPPRPYGHGDLNAARLPIPPHPRVGQGDDIAPRLGARTRFADLDSLADGHGSGGGFVVAPLALLASTATRQAAIV